MSARERSVTRSTSPTIRNGSVMANGDAAATFAEAELLLVEQRRRAPMNPTKARDEERQAPPDPVERADLVHGAPTLGERRRLLLGVDDLLGGAGRVAFPAAPDRLAQLQSEQREDHGRNDEDQERHTPAEPVSEAGLR